MVFNNVISSIVKIHNNIIWHKLKGESQVTFIVSEREVFKYAGTPGEIVNSKVEYALVSAASPGKLASN